MLSRNISSATCYITSILFTVVSANYTTTAYHNVCQQARTLKIATLCKSVNLIIFNVWTNGRTKENSTIFGRFWWEKKIGFLWYFRCFSLRKQLSITFIWSIRWCNRYFWQCWTIKWIYFPVSVHYNISNISIFGVP